LLRKLEYIEDIGAVQTTEQFIELAASSRSTTDQPCGVERGNGAPVQSGGRLSSHLQVMGSAG
jgi:hypothetical protein